VGIIGGGTVGMNAARIAVGLGAQVTILDISRKRLAELEEIFAGRVTTLLSTEENLKQVLQTSDLVIGAVLIPGASAPKLIKRADLKLMQPGAVIVDVAVDQGGCCETTRPTTHDDPTYVVDGVLHYCVANMPGAVPITSTRALTAVTLSYGLELANKGLEKAINDNDALRKGVNVINGQIVHPQVAKSLDLPYREWL
jgi:alanine dehydrogenase